MYSIKYGFDLQAKKKGFTKEEVEMEGKGGCDALLLVSITREGEHPHEGSKSFQMVTFDGFNEGENIPDTEIFQIFAHIANYLTSDDVEVPDWQRQIARETFAKTKEKIDSLQTSPKINGKSGG